jgi:hypothetical protein
MYKYLCKKMKLTLPDIRNELPAAQLTPGPDLNFGLSRRYQIQ